MEKTIPDILLRITIRKLCLFLTMLYVVVLFSICLFIIKPTHDSVEELNVMPLVRSELKETRTLLNYTKNPTIVWWNLIISSLEDSTIRCGKLPCDIYHNAKLPPDTEGAYLFYASSLNFSDLPLPRYSTKVLWGLSHEESPRNVDELMHEKGLSLFNYSSTYSRFSDVPFPLHQMISMDNITSQQYFVKTAVKNSLLTDISPILYIQSDCDTSTERDKYVAELMKLQQVDSYGSCLNNKKMPEQFKKDYLNKLEDHSFLRFVAKYKFVIAIENGVCEDYVTEKFWRAIHVGVVPIYFGSPSIRDWLPNENSAILLQDFPTPKLLSDHINRLMHDDALYEQYLEHKTKSIISNKNLIEELHLRPYQTDYSASKLEFVCFMCKKLYEMKSNNNKTKRVISKAHFNCPKPISALSQKVNPNNQWVSMWASSKHQVEMLYDKISRS